MEKTNMKKWIATVIILVVLAVAGFAFSLLKSEPEPKPFEGATAGGLEPLPAKVDEDTAEDIRKELGAAPESVPADKAEVREELSKPPEGGSLSEEEKARIRAELRK